jgi:hypothetical protein
MATCPNCGRESPDEFEFCPACGQPLTSPPAGREVRKTVTVVFCDVTGSTALGERLDPESLRDVKARYFEAMRGAIESHGGTVEKYIGDAVMAVFGIPQLHEDDALRAARAAADMREGLASLNRVDLPEVIEAKVCAVLEGDEHQEVACRHISQLMGVAESAAGEETFWAIRRFFEAVARERPLVVVFDAACTRHRRSRPTEATGTSSTTGSRRRSATTPRAHVGWSASSSTPRSARMERRRAGRCSIEAPSAIRGDRRRTTS